MTKCKYGCDREVPILCASYDGSGSLNSERFHILFVKSGTIWLNINGIRCYVTVGSVICLSKPFRFEIQHTSDLEAVHLSFTPEYIHFDLNWKTILLPKYEDECKKLHYPTFEIFLKHDELFAGVITSNNDSFFRIISYYDSIKKQIESQPDEWWACRSKFYVIRIIYILNTIRSGITTELKKDSLFLQAKIYIANHMHEKLTVDILCKHLLIDKNKLNKLFQANSRMTFSDYIDKQRLDLVCENLAIEDLKITEIMTMIGFNDYANFINYFKNKMGVTPSQFRARSKGDRNEARNHKA